MTRLTVFSTALAMILTAAATPAQQARDSAPTSPAVDGAVVAGVLVASDTGTPVRGARVAIVGPSLPDGRALLTGDSGEFLFEAVPPGRYHLWARKQGFVASSYGEKRPGAGLPGRPLIVVAGQRLDKLQFVLSRGATISGVITDAFGDPAADTIVYVQQVLTRAGRRVLIPAGVGFADDLGVYRAFSLAPGEFIVSVHPTGPSLRGALLAGPDPINAYIAGNAPGSLFNIAPVGHVPARLETSPTYFPNATTVVGAQPITLAADEHRSGVDIRLQQQPRMTVSGVVLTPDALSTDSIVALMHPAGPLEDPASPFRWGGSSKLSPDRSFRVTGVPSGQYVLVVLARTTGGANQEPRWAQQPLSVGGADIEGLAVPLQPALTLSATLASDDGTTTDLPRTIVLKPVETMFRTGAQSQLTMTVQERRFSSSAVLPGKYTIDLPSPGPWRIASATFDGRDAMDFLLDVTPGAKLTGHVVLTRRGTELSGTLIGAPVTEANYTVVALSFDERYWVPQNRRNVAVAPDADGRFSFRNLPGGTYRLAVVEDFDAAAGLDPALLRQLAAQSSVVVTLTDGEKKVQDLRVR